MPDTIRQKVHTLAGHPPEILRAKSVHTRQPPLPQTPPPHSGRLNPAERLSRGCWPASPFFLLFLPFLFGFVGRGAAVCPVLVHTLPAAAVKAVCFRCILLLLPPGHAAGRCPPARPGSLYAYFFVFVVHLSFPFFLCSFFCLFIRCIPFLVHIFQPFFLVL